MRRGSSKGNRIHCSLPGSLCYAEFTNGQSTYLANVPPVGFVPDNGSPCSAPKIDGSGQAVCNNGFEVYSLDYPDPGNLPGRRPRSASSLAHRLSRHRPPQQLRRFSSRGWRGHHHLPGHDRSHSRALQPRFTGYGSCWPVLPRPAQDGIPVAGNSTGATPSTRRTGKSDLNPKG